MPRGSRLLFDGSMRHARIPIKPVRYLQETVGRERPRTESSPNLAIHHDVHNLPVQL